MTTQRKPVTAEEALFSFYDIESLKDAFTLCSYTPRPDGSGSVEVFYLLDDQPDGTNLTDSISKEDLAAAIFSRNPGLPPYPSTQLHFYDLRTQAANERLAMLVGLSSADQVCHRNDPSIYDDRFRPVCDTDDEYDPRIHPFLTGYNSMNYDTTMLALYLNEAFPAPHGGKTFQRTTALTMREHNDKLFSADHIEYMPGYLGWDGTAAKIRRAMLHSGRHVDAARLNELQFKVSLKRLLGMLGRQIMESEKLSHDTSITTLEELYELLAYNVSDCLGLSHEFRDPTYAGNFDLKAGLLAQYDETRFNKNGSIRRDRLNIDSSSAKFVGRILAPYTALSDIEAVSFDYPHPQIAAERRANGEDVQTVNVLDECVKFFEENVAPNPATHPEATDAQKAAHAQFMQVVDYYRSIEGKNFNDSEEYADKFDLPAHNLRNLPKAPNNVPYFKADATPSSCFATFSTGGIHGAEVDMDVFIQEKIEYLEQDSMLARAKQEIPDARDFVVAAKDQHNALRLPDGSWVDKRLVLLGSDPAKVKYRKPKKDNPEQAEQLQRAQAQVPEAADLLALQRPSEQALNVVLPDGTVLVGKTVLANTTATKAAYREEPSKKKPQLFIDKEDGSTKLHPKFVRTSAGLVIHEDFTSYYPNLLRNMRAFYNPELGEDRYAKIFFEKERYGQQMSEIKGRLARLRQLDASGPSRDEINAMISEQTAELERLGILRNGTKLILNSASGAGDAGHRTPIRMNNQIISMRILGQLFSWRIGQAQTLAGGRIISTNTDGLYSVVGGDNGFDEATNNQVLAEQQAAIGIDIEPELMFLISKDSNNRLELKAPPEGGTVADSEIITAGGGTLACYKGPSPTKSLAHPAVIDFALARYLQTVASRGEAALAEPFDYELGRKMIQEAVDQGDPVKTLRLFQNVIAASRGSITYPFAADPLPAEGAWIDVEVPRSLHDVGPDGTTQIKKELDRTLVRNPRALQMVNRVFVVHTGTPEAVSLHNAGAWKVTEASQAKRRQNGGWGVRRDPVAIDILRHHGWAKTRAEASASDGLTVLPDDRDVVIRRINGIDPTWSMLIVNDDLYTLSPARVEQMISALNLDIYVQMLEETFTKNWMNLTP